jgi:hypothetical protein
MKVSGIWAKNPQRSDKTNGKPYFKNKSFENRAIFLKVKIYRHNVQHVNKGLKPLASRNSMSLLR